MNIGDILIGAAVLVALLLALGAMSKNQAKGGCSGNCGSCSMSTSCQSKREK